MRFHLFKYTCNQCGSIYKAPELGADSYGEFLMRSSAGETVYLNALDDPIYAEVDALLRKLPKVKDEGAVRLASIQRKIFGVACDPDAAGNRFGIETKPPCQYCDNEWPSYWEATDPPEFVDMDVREITHHEWMQLNQSMKLELLENAIKSEI